MVGVVFTWLLDAKFLRIFVGYIAKNSELYHGEVYLFSSLAILGSQFLTTEIVLLFN